MNVCTGTSTPMSFTSKPLMSSMKVTMFLPMSCKSPCTVPISTFASLRCPPPGVFLWGAGPPSPSRMSGSHSINCLSCSLISLMVAPLPICVSAGRSRGGRLDAAAQPRLGDDLGQHCLVAVAHQVHAADAFDARQRLDGLDSHPLALGPLLRSLADALQHRLGNMHPGHALCHQPQRRCAAERA